MTDSDIIIVGGGISGLSAAYELSRAGALSRIIERRPRTGGVIETRQIEGCTLECGPDSFLAQKPEALQLIRDLGLDAGIIGSNDRERRTYIWKRGQLVEIPEGVMMIVPSRIMPMAVSPLLSWSTKIRMGLEYFRKPGGFPQTSDRSVAEFVTDHFGAETLDYLAEPLLAGIYGGDPSRLSVRSVLPRFAQMEAKYGSLVRAVLASKRETAKRGAAAPGPLFQTLQGGLSTLIQKLSETANVSHAEVESMERQPSGGFRIRVGGSWLDASHVILAVPAWSAAQLVQSMDGRLADLMRGIEYSSSMTVTLLYRESEFDGMRAGHGFLVPKVERHRLAACTYVHSKFLGRVPDGVIALRCFFGGASDAAILSKSDEDILAIAREDLQSIAKITAKPIGHLVARWPQSMAQYTVGHAERVKEIQARLVAIPGLQLAGNAYDGIGIPDCIRTGRAAARAVLASRESTRA